MDRVEQVILVESVEEARAAVAYLGQMRPRPAGVKIVGLTPGARALLKSQGFTAIDTLPFLDNAAHGRLVQVTQQFIELIDDNLSLDLGDGLSHAYTHWFSFHGAGVLRQMLWRIELLDGIRRAYPSSRFAACVPPHKGGALGSLARKFGFCHGVEFEAISPDDIALSPGPQPPDRKKATVGWLERLMVEGYCRASGFWPGDRLVLSAGLIGGQDAVLLRSIGERFPGVRLLSLRYHRYGRGKELALALFTLACRALRIQPGRRVLNVPMPMIADSLRGEGDSHARQNLEKALSSLLERIGDRLVHRGVSFADEFRARVGDWVLPQVAEFYEVARAQEQLLGHVRPDLMIAPSGAHVHQSLASLCGRRGIPALLIPMKSLVPPEGPLEELGIGQIGIELVTDDFPYVAAQSPLTAGYLEWSGYAGQRIETGPLIWSRLTDADRHRQRQRFFEKMGGPGAILVYAPSNKWTPPFYVAQTRDEVLSTAADLAELVADRENLYLVLRLHPAPSLTIADVETLVDLPPNAVVDYGDRVSFAGVLALADLLVTDTSTAAEEAIQNRIPVVLYDKWARYNHLKAPRVTADHPDSLSPAYYVDAREKLAFTLEWILAHHPVGTDMPERLKSRFVYAEGHREAFYRFVEQALGWMR